MKQEIQPLDVGALPELSRFLVEGFRTAPTAEFADPEVLKWKYFDPTGTDDRPRSFIARDHGRIVGHAGWCNTSFVKPGPAAESVPTLHLIDWLGSPKHPAIGSKLMLQAFRYAPTQYSVGGTDAADRVQQRAGFKDVTMVPLYKKPLRARYWLRMPAYEPRWKHPLRVARDVARAAGRRGEPPEQPVTLKRVNGFGAEIGSIIAAREVNAVFTSREPELLNHFLRYPRGTFSGWFVVQNDRPCGFAILNVVSAGALRVGKIAECFLAPADRALWHAAVFALANELGNQDADVVLGYGSTPWMAAALEANGFYYEKSRRFLLRDPEARVPAEISFHLTLLEADHAYLEA